MAVEGYLRVLDDYLGSDSSAYGAGEIATGNIDRNLISGEDTEQLTESRGTIKVISSLIGRAFSFSYCKPPSSLPANPGLIYSDTTDKIVSDVDDGLLSGTFDFLEGTASQSTKAGALIDFLFSSSAEQLSSALASLTFGLAAFPAQLSSSRGIIWTETDVHLASSAEVLTSVRARLLDKDREYCVGNATSSTESSALIAIDQPIQSSTYQNTFVASSTLTTNEPIESEASESSRAEGRLANFENLYGLATSRSESIGAINREKLSSTASTLSYVSSSFLALSIYSQGTSSQSTGADGILTVHDELAAGDCVQLTACYGSASYTINVASNASNSVSCFGDLTYNFYASGAAVARTNTRGSLTSSESIVGECTQRTDMHAAYLNFVGYYSLIASAQELTSSNAFLIQDELVESNCAQLTSSYGLLQHRFNIASHTVQETSARGTLTASESILGFAAQLSGVSATLRVTGLPLSGNFTIKEYDMCG